MRTSLRLVLLSAAFVAGTGVAARRAAAQAQPARQWEPRGFDVTADGVWRRKAAAVRSARMAALARGDFSSLNSPMSSRPGLMSPGAGPSASAMSVGGVLPVPVFLVNYKNTSVPSLR